MKLLSLDEFRHSLRTANEVRVDGPEMKPVWEQAYSGATKALVQFQVAHKKARQALDLLVDKTSTEHPYLDMVPLKKAMTVAWGENEKDLQWTIQQLKTAKVRTAGLNWNWHPGVLGAKAAIAAVKYIYQKLRRAKDPNAYAAVKDLSTAVKAIQNSWRTLGDGKDELYWETQQMLVKAFSELSGYDKASSLEMVEESENVYPIHHIYPLSQHKFSHKIHDALYALEVQAKSGPPVG